jgi:hypothetical protein
MRMPIRCARAIFALLIGALASSACVPTSQAPALPIATPTNPPSIAIGLPTITPTPGLTETAAPTETAALAPTSTTTIRRIATPTLGIPPGVYVSAIKIDPPSAKSNQVPQITVTFVNTTGQVKRYRWFIKIFAPDQTPSFGETPKVESDIAPATSQLKALSEWRTQTFFNCLSFTARAFWVDADNQVIEFLKPDRSSPGTGFSVCP